MDKEGVLSQASALGLLRSRLKPEDYVKVERINNARLHQFLAKYIDLCNPAKVYVCTGTPAGRAYMRSAALQNREEAPLAIPGHTVHFDNYLDQGRDKEGTKILLSKGMDLGGEINTTDRKGALQEIHELLKGIMAGRELLVKFFCLGPVNSRFSLPCVQLTDSAYVAHTEDLLYREGYEKFVREGAHATFFRFVHSAGDLEEAGLGLKVAKNLSLRRIYMDIEDETIFSVNTQYGGNTIGLKKLAMRLAIKRASQEGWLTEHMMIMGVQGSSGRKSYFTGAFPSMCGKTSTAMMQGETIVGDDIAYLRAVGGVLRAVNVERGIFGIIDGLNSGDDPLQWKVLRSPGEIIFSNVLVTEGGDVHWNGMDGEGAQKGVNYSGEWFAGKKDAHGKRILPSHTNARFTLDMRMLDNVDPGLEMPEGVEVQGVIYGGRDSDTSVPVEEAFDWVHGIVTKGACLESETTAATLGQAGVRVFNPMSNLDFLSIPIGEYVQNNLNMGKALQQPPRIFSVNYFLRGREGQWLNHKNDKKVWLKWMALRVQGEAEAIETPTGRIPLYEDLRRLFREHLDKEYSHRDYEEQFLLRIKENLARIERMRKIFTEQVTDTPEAFFPVLDEQKARLEAVQAKHGDYVTPDTLAQRG